MNENEEELPVWVNPEGVEETQEPEVEKVEETEEVIEEKVTEAADIDPDVDEMQVDPVRTLKNIIEDVESLLDRMGSLQGVSQLKELTEEVKASL